MTDNLNDLKAKIAKLLAKAEGTDNQAEAAIFMAKVNELLERHQIDLHTIRAMGGDNDPVGREKGSTNIYASMLWARTLAGQLANYYGCKFIFWKRGNHFTYEVVGRESARTTFELMLPFVISQVKVQAKVLHLDNRHMTRSVAEREVGQALTIRISRLTKDAVAHRSELTGKGLIPVSDLDAFVADEFGSLKTAKAKVMRYGYDAQRLAERVSLNVQTTHSANKRIA